MTFRILLVCSGNICRSPMAEQLLRIGLDGVDVSVASAGTIAWVGEPMDSDARAIAERLGVTDAAAHVARRLDAASVRDADLVLALAREHEGAIVELVPGATRSTFTLREFAALAASVTDADLDQALAATDGLRDREPVDVVLGAAVAAVAAQRGIAESLAVPDDADVIDPFRRGAAAYEESAAQLVPAVNAVAALLHRAAGRM